MFIQFLIYILQLMTLGCIRLASSIVLPIVTAIINRGIKSDEKNQKSKTIKCKWQLEKETKSEKHGKFSLSNFMSRYGADKIQERNTKKKRKHNISGQNPQRRKMMCKLLKKNEYFGRKRNSFKLDITGLSRTSTICCPLQRGFYNVPTNSSSESDEETGQRMEEFVNENGAEGFPIQCEDDILNQFPISEAVEELERSRELSSILVTSGSEIRSNARRHFSYNEFEDEYIDLHPEIPELVEELERRREPSSILVTSGSEIGSNWRRHFSYNEFEDEYIDLHPEIPIRGIQGVQGQLNETSLQTAQPLQPLLGTDLGHSSIHRHSPFDGGTESVQEEDQGATGGVPNTDDVRSLGRPRCSLCKKRKINVRFEPCDHEICCLECSLGPKMCFECKVQILRKIYTGHYYYFV